MLRRSSRRGEALRLRKHDQKQQQTEHEVHERAGTEDQKPFPRRLARERARVVDRLVLARHGAKPADRQAADGVERLPLLLFPDGGAHEQGELIHLNTKGFSKSEVPQLMNKDQKAEKDNCENNAHIARIQARLLLEHKPTYTLNYPFLDNVDE